MEDERSVAYVGRSDEMGVYRGFAFILGDSSSFTQERMQERYEQSEET